MWREYSNLFLVLFCRGSRLATASVVAGIVWSRAASASTPAREKRAYAVYERLAGSLGGSVVITVAVRRPDGELVAGDLYSRNGYAHFDISFPEIVFRCSIDVAISFVTDNRRTVESETEQLRHDKKLCKDLKYTLLYSVSEK